MIFTFSQYQIDIEVEKTKEFYSKAEYLTEGCSCQWCQNYEKAADKLSPNIHDFFAQLGVDIKKPAEVYMNCPNEDGTIYYGGFYHLCGRLLTGESAWQEAGNGVSQWKEEMCHRIDENYAVSFQEEAALVEKGFPMPVLQMEIAATIPWVLEENV